MSERLVMNVQTGELEVIPLTPEEIAELQEANPGWVPPDAPPAE
jgi:hypothetical protein